MVTRLQTTLTVLASMLLVCTALARAQQAQVPEVDSSMLPAKADVESMERTCAGSTTGLHSLKAKVAAAVDDWRNTAASESLPEAQLGLDKVFDDIRSAGGLSPQMTLYVSCMEKALRQVLTQALARPRSVNGVGISHPLSSTAFASEREMWSRGCRDAESAAVAKVRADCSERIFVLATSECTQGAGNPRTFTVQVFGECRVR